MALPLGKLVLLAGAGLIGASTIYAKDSGITYWVSGVTKILKQLKQDNGSGKKPQNDSLMAQVNSLRQELQLLASNRPVTIITSGGTGANKYYIIIVVGVIGYGYVWWKGWKLPDMMFATRRTLSDACNSVAQRLDTVYASLLITKKELSTDISNLDTKLIEIEEITESTQGIVVDLRQGSEKFGTQFQSFKNVVEKLESRVDKFAVEQEKSVGGVFELMRVAHRAQTGLVEDNRQTSPPSVPQIAFPPRIQTALPPAADGPSPRPAASNPSAEVQHAPRRVSSLPSTPQDNRGARITELIDQGMLNGIITPEVTDGGASSSSSSSANQRPSFLSRTLSSAAGTVLRRTGLKQ